MLSTASARKSAPLNTLIATEISGLRLLQVCSSIAKVCLRSDPLDSEQRESRVRLCASWCRTSREGLKGASHKPSRVLDRFASPTSNTPSHRENLPAARIDRLAQEESALLARCVPPRPQCSD